MRLDLYFFSKQKAVESNNHVANGNNTDKHTELGYFRKFNALFY